MTSVKWLLVGCAAGMALALGSFIVLAFQVGATPGLAVLGLAISVLSVLAYTIVVRDRAIVEYDSRRAARMDVTTLVAKGLGDGKAASKNLRTRTYRHRPLSDREAMSEDRAKLTQDMDAVGGDLAQALTKARNDR